METDIQNNQEALSRTFTQDEVNSFLAKDRKHMEEKYSDYDELKEKAARLDSIEEANKTELQKASERVATLEAELATMKKSEEIRAIRDKVSKDTGIPANLLTADNEEECKAQAEAIKAFANPSYPSIKDGGEIQNTQKADTRTQFADWASKVL